MLEAPDCKTILLATTVGNVKSTVWRISILMFRCNRSTRIRSGWGGGGGWGVGREEGAFASSLPPMCNPLAAPHIKDVPPC